MPENESTLRQEIELLSADEVADLLRCSVNHVKALPIPMIRLGRLVRYRGCDVRQFIEANIEEAAHA